MPQATVGRRCNFDGSEPVTCVLQEGNRRGVQIVAEGFFIDDATVITISAMGAETQVSPPEGESELVHVMIGYEGFAFKGLRIQGLPAGGDYAVTIIA